MKNIITKYVYILTYLGAKKEIKKEIITWI